MGSRPGGVVVVEQQAHAHAAFGRLPQRLEQQVAGLVGVPDVVLDVERAVGGSGEDGARGERRAGLGDRVDPGVTRMGGSTRPDGAAEPGHLSVAERKGHPIALVLVEPRGSRREGLILPSA